MKSSFYFILIILVCAAEIQSLAQISDHGGKIKSITVFEAKSNTLVGKQYKDSETWFDQQGNIVEEIVYREGRIKKHFKYQYDQNGNKIREEEFDPYGKLKESTEYKFESGLRVEKIVYDPNHKVRLKRSYVYTKF
jgi:hypothetical protein